MNAGAAINAARPPADDEARVNVGALPNAAESGNAASPAPSAAADDGNTVPPLHALLDTFGELSDDAKMKVQKEELVDVQVAVAVGKRVKKKFTGTLVCCVTVGEEMRRSARVVQDRARKTRNELETAVLSALPGEPYLSEMMDAVQRNHDFGYEM